MKKTILIVEDDHVTALLMKRFCIELGNTAVDIISNGEEAISSVNTLNPHVVLMDITLEGEIDGIEAADRIYRHSNVPVIFITTSADDQTVTRAMSSNPFGYIIKPFTKKDIKTAIEMALLRHTLEHTIRENEYRMTTILNSIGDAVVVVNHDETITYMNPVAELMTEQNLHTTLGSHFSSVIHIETAAGKRLKHINSFEREEENPRLYIIQKSGNPLPIDYKISARRDNRGGSLGTVMVFRDITERVFSEDKLKETLAYLRRAMGGIIEAMDRTVESRDPYTAGHQRRVSDLARNMAEHMGLSADKIEGIRMAGMIHDLGKISIPAEILSKPARLTPVEFNLVKSHVQIGYDILKTIDFPWPVAAIVYEHHERMDGSGYPRGLTGDNISMAGRLIAVADVVEAMASHRPYRASLGIEKALDEIRNMSGTLYDSDAVKCCISLFRDKNYVLAEKDTR